MKKCFSTVACMDASFQEVMAYAQRHGIEGVEIRLGADESVCGEREPSALLRGKRLLEKAGIAIVNLGSGVCLRGYDEAALQQGRQAVDTACLMGAKAVRVFLGNFAQRADAPRLPIHHAGIIRALQALCDAAGEKGVDIWVETHNEYATGKVLGELLASVCRPNLKIIWDVMHPIEAGEALEDTWRELNLRIAHVHIKDGLKRADPVWHDYQYTRLTEGELPLEALLALLKREDYGGYVSLEWETAWRAELREYHMTVDDALEHFVRLMERCQATT